MRMNVYLQLMKTAVTGANGHLGAALVRQLLESGHEVRTLVHARGDALEGLPVEYVKGSILDTSCVRRLATGCDVVFHLAARISIGGDSLGVMSRVNVGGTRQVLDACLAAGVRRLVHFSSVHAFRPPPVDQVFSEDATLAGPGDLPYCITKSAAQQLVLAAAAERQLEVVVLNPCAVIGPWDYRPSLQGQMLLDFMAGRIPAVPPGGFNWVDSMDVANAAIAAMDGGDSGEAYLLPGHYYRVSEIGARVRRLVGKTGSPVEVPYAFLYAILPPVQLWNRMSGRPALFTRESLRHLQDGHPGVSGARAASVLGFRARPLDETLEDTVNWFRRTQRDDQIL
jgi:dihydroflavonol-4-reductase